MQPYLSVGCTARSAPHSPLPDLRHAPPWQICARPPPPWQVLVEGDVVTGLLDFEFCAYDWRAMELAVALSKWVPAVVGARTSHSDNLKELLPHTP